HAYTPGRSTESALHEVAIRIERALDVKQSTLGTFIDIEGAFDKTTFVAIERALVQRGVSATLSGWIRHMLEWRIIKTGDNSSNTGRMALVGRGCPQGGVLSPLLWNLVVDELLSLLNNSGFYTVGYADDLVILLTGNHKYMLCELMQTALHQVERWCQENEIGRASCRERVEVEVGGGCGKS